MQLIESICDFYQTLALENLGELNRLYAEDIHFVDPVTEHRGLPVVHQYFANLLQNTQECRFSIQAIPAADQQHFLLWVMTFRHPKLGKSAIAVQGISHLKITDNKISFQRDYYDLGEMLYEHIPLVGGAVKHLKKRLAE